MEHRCYPGGLQLVGKLTQGLIHGLRRIDLRNLHGNVAGAGLAHLHQVLDELFHPVGLAVQHLQIGLLLLGGVGFFQQVHIVDDGGQGRFDIVGHVGDQLGLHAFGFQLILSRHHRHIRQTVQLFGELPEGADEVFVIHLGLQITAAHTLGSVQQRAEAVGAIEHHRQCAAAPQDHHTLHPLRHRHQQPQNQHHAHHQPLPDQRQPGEQPLAQPHKAPQPAMQPGKELFRHIPAQYRQRRGNLPDVLQNALCQAIQPRQQPEKTRPAFFQHPEGQLQAPAQEGIGDPVLVFHLHLGGKGKAEAHEGQTAHIAHAAPQPQEGGHALPFQPSEIQFIQNRYTQNQHQDHTAGVQIQGQGVQATGPDLLCALPASGGTAEVHRADGEQKQPAEQSRRQQIFVYAQLTQQGIRRIGRNGPGSQGKHHRNGCFQGLLLCGVAYAAVGVVIAACVVNAFFQAGFFVIPFRQKLLVFQIRKGEFQLLLRILDASIGIQNLSAFVQNGIGVAVLVQPVPQHHVPESIRHILRHISVFHGCPVGGKATGLGGKHGLGGFRHRFFKGLFPQQVLGGQNTQSQSASRRSQQSGGTERYGNKFQPQRVSHGLASIL